MSKDRAASLIFLVIGIYGLVFSIGIPMGGWESPGAGIFPLSISILLCLSGASWFVASRKRVPGEALDWRTVRENAVRPLQVAGVTLVFILIVDDVGYLLGSSLFLFALLFLVSRYRFPVALASAAALGGGSWFLFAKILGVELPVGPEFLSF